MTVPKISCKLYYTPMFKDFYAQILAIFFSHRHLLMTVFAYYNSATSPYIHVPALRPPTPHKILLHTFEFLLHTLCSKTHYFRPCVQMLFIAYTHSLKWKISLCILSYGYCDGNRPRCSTDLIESSLRQHQRRLFWCGYIYIYTNLHKHSLLETHWFTVRATSCGSAITSPYTALVVVAVVDLMKATTSQKESAKHLASSDVYVILFIPVEIEYLFSLYGARGNYR